MKADITLTKEDLIKMIKDQIKGTQQLGKSDIQVKVKFDNGEIKDFKCLVFTLEMC